jgi:hypothetical protein
MLLGRPREDQERIANNASLFAWVYSKYRKHGCHPEIGLLIDEQLAAWRPPAKAH